MRSSISPPYPKDLQILHDFNYIDPITPLFDKKLDILKKKTFNANEILNDHNYYLHTLKEAYEKEKNRIDILYNHNKALADSDHQKNTRDNSKATSNLFKTTSIQTSITFKNFFFFWQKIFDNFLGLVNGNIGALILGIIAFIVFLILVLWLFGVISFDSNKSTSTTSTTSSYEIPKSSELLPTSSSSSEIETSFSFIDFLKQENKLQYTTQHINKAFNDQASSSPTIQKIKDNYKNIFDRLSDTAQEFGLTTQNNILEIDKSPYVSKSHHFHDILYLPISATEQIALFKPKNFSITSVLDSRYDEYKFLISKITNYSLNDFSEIKIIFEEYNDTNINDNGFLKIKEIISNINDKIIFYDRNKSTNDNIINVDYEPESTDENGKIIKAKINIKFNQNKFKNNADKILPPLF